MPLTKTVTKTPVKLTCHSQSVARKTPLTGVDQIKEDGGGHLLELLENVFCRWKCRHLKKQTRCCVGSTNGSNICVQY